MRILVAGATGAIGRQLVPELAARGHTVVGLTRAAKRAEEVRALGAEPVTGDVLDRDGVLRAVEKARPEVVIHQATSLPPRLNPRRIRQDLAATNRLRSEGTRNLMRAARECGAGRVIAQSIAFAYAPDGDTPATEEEPLFFDAPGGFDEAVEALAALEDAVLHEPEIEGIVLRYGYLYGPGTAYGPGGWVVQDVRARKFPTIGSGAGQFSFVHVDDVATATAEAVERGEPGIYNVVDDEPARVIEWLPLLAELLGAPRPMRVPSLIGRLAAGPFGVHMMTRQRGASNEKAKAGLIWTLRYSTWREGLAADLVEQR
ncbi:MAG TPA: NAD(P)-dependent oxidoreductase [Anaerolineae bacterium]|nr:NAD(P)-dependent oxidoreductase [Anaerolineae bacterium]